MYQLIDVMEGGHPTERVNVCRIPCVGEYMVIWGRSYRVAKVTHYPTASCVFQNAPSAVVTVTDE